MSVKFPETKELKKPLQEMFEENISGRGNLVFFDEPISKELAYQKSFVVSCFRNLIRNANGYNVY